jgi:BlaI family transcriptional regulator, penicillinase repressor
MKVVHGMTVRPALSKGELEVARVLWDLGSATVREVFEAFPADRDIDFSTVQTYLRRLEQKGYARAKLAGRTRVYSPSVKPRTVIRETLNDLIDRLFGGETLPMMRHLVEEGKITAEDLAELRAMIDRMEQR